MTPPSFIRNKRVLVTGGAGFLGRHVCRELLRYEPADILVPRSREHDLRQPAVVRSLLRSYQPQIVVHLAAVVGGIGANRENPGRYFYENAVMAIHLMEEARQVGVEKFVALGTICSYPKFTPVPFQEQDLWNGYPEETNAPYGLAKKMLLVQGQAYRQQYGFRAITLLPVNLYGPGDNFDPRTSHVIPALIRKVVEAKSEGRNEIEVWGTGAASREFLFVRDAALGIALATAQYDSPEPMNLGSGQEISIRALVEMICELSQFRGDIRWDPTKPDGQPRRCLDTSRARDVLGFTATTSLRDGLLETIAWYEQQSDLAQSTGRPTGNVAEDAEGSKRGDASSPSSHSLPPETPSAALSKVVPIPNPSDSKSDAKSGATSDSTSDARSESVSEMSGRRALITGITGQDGSYLAELLLEKGYEVHGLVRRSSTFSTERIEHLYQDPHCPDARLALHYGDLTDGQSVTNWVLDLEPDEIYNLGAQSHVRVSFDQPVYTLQATAGGALNVLEAARQLNKRKRVKVYQASSSEMFGDALETPQNEKTPFRPQSPYGCAKVYAFHQTVNYRASYELYAVNGILFNHESPRRGETFVTRKITRAATRIKLGLQDKLFLGNLQAQRDWGYAKDFVEGMWRMLQQPEPDDYVLATGETHTVQKFVDLVFALLELNPSDYISIDPRYFRPAEVNLLLGDATKAREKLGWTPTTTFGQLAQLMVDHDLKLARQEAVVPSNR